MALGDTITIQLLQAITGYGAAGDVITVTETLQVEAMIAHGQAALYTGPVAPVRRSSSCSGTYALPTPTPRCVKS